MAKSLGIIALTVIVLFLGFSFYSDSKNVDDIMEEVGASVSQLQEVTRKIQCYTETKDFTCGTVTFNYNNNQIIEETETIEVTEIQKVIEADGSITIENVTVTKVIPKVSTADLQFLDRQTGEFMVCRQGHQCLIEAQIELFMVDETYVEPPYLYALTITCEFRDYCDSGSTVSTNAGTTTDGGGGVSYSWTTDNKDQLGDYEIILSIRSAVADNNGNSINLVQKIPLVLIS